MLLALAFYALNRRSALRLRISTRESAELRHLNIQLQQEVAERQRVQEDLAVAEQTLEQSSKLAALGEMSAAVSHELNQPLAAMKTYLAGARLLLRRNRPDEAVVSFGRIDDLIERMGAITRQLKFYARKGQDALSPVNMGDALASSLSMMEPQLRQRRVQINQYCRVSPWMVMADRMRIEQVMVNLLRNALMPPKRCASREDRHHAEQQGEDRHVDRARQRPRDRGPRCPVRAVLHHQAARRRRRALGLAISSGIVNDLGGRLTARNSTSGGAVFEMQLPIMGSEADNGDRKIKAAE